jgi:uncharacterized protein Usg
MDHFKLQLSGFRLTTAEILYHLPDYPDLLQSYIWQDYDQAPTFPVLHQFLHFWQTNLEGKLHSVKLASANWVTPTHYGYSEGFYKLH